MDNCELCKQKYNNDYDIELCENCFSNNTFMFCKTAKIKYKFTPSEITQIKKYTFGGNIYGNYFHYGQYFSTNDITTFQNENIKYKNRINDQNNKKRLAQEQHDGIVQKRDYEIAQRREFVLSILYKTGYYDINTSPVCNGNITQDISQFINYNYCNGMTMDAIEEYIVFMVENHKFIDARTFMKLRATSHSSNNSSIFTNYNHIINVQMQERINELKEILCISEQQILTHKYCKVYINSGINGIKQFSKNQINNLDQLIEYMFMLE
jgi:hypothetical protein